MSLVSNTAGYNLRLLDTDTEHVDRLLKIFESNIECLIKFPLGIQSCVTEISESHEKVSGSTIFAESREVLVSKIQNCSLEKVLV